MIILEFIYEVIIPFIITLAAFIGLMLLLAWIFIDQDYDKYIRITSKKLKPEYYEDARYRELKAKEYENISK